MGSSCPNQMAVGRKLALLMKTYEVGPAAPAAYQRETIPHKERVNPYGTVAAGFDYRARGIGHPDHIELMDHEVEVILEDGIGVPPHAEHFIHIAAIDIARKDIPCRAVPFLQRPLCVFVSLW